MNKSINASISTESYLLGYLGIALNPCQSMIARAMDTRRAFEAKYTGASVINSQGSLKTGVGK